MCCTVLAESPAQSHQWHNGLMAITLGYTCQMKWDWWESRQVSCWVPHSGWLRSDCQKSHVSYQEPSQLKLRYFCSFADGRLTSVDRICSGFNMPHKSTGSVLEHNIWPVVTFAEGKLLECPAYTKAVSDPCAIQRIWNSQHSELLLTEGGLFMDIILCLVEWKHLRESQTLGGKCIHSFLERKLEQFFPWLCSSLVITADSWHLSSLFFPPSLRRWELMSELFTSVYRCILASGRKTGRTADLSDSPILSLQSVTSTLNRYSI